MQFLKQSLFLGALALFVAACGNAPEGQKVGAGDAVEAAAREGTAYKVDAAQSSINWTGSKLVGGQHTGTLAIKSGEIFLSNGQITGGEFIIDMASLTDTDLAPGEGKEKLEGHLKSADFFDVEKHPEAKFTISSVVPSTDGDGTTHKATGNLTIMGVTKSVTIPLEMKSSETDFAAYTPPFNINRTDWGVKYGSGILGIAQDEIIRDEVGLQISLVASR